MSLPGSSVCAIVKQAQATIQQKETKRNMSLFQLKLEYLCFNPRLSFIVSLDFSLKFKFSFSECGTGATEIFGGLKADRQDLCGAIN